VLAFQDGICSVELVDRGKEKEDYSTSPSVYYSLTVLPLESKFDSVVKKPYIDMKYL
jgi:hypothetical protein